MKKIITIVIAFYMVCFSSQVLWSQTIDGPLSEFNSETVYNSESIIYGLESGDFDVAEGIEVAVLIQTGGVLSLDPNTWQAESIHDSTDSINAMTDRPTVDIGNVSGDEQNEVVVNGGRLVYVLEQMDDNEWNSTIVYDITGFTGQLWGAHVGDADPRIEGEEIVVINETVFDISIADLVDKPTEEWTRRTIYQEQVGMDAAIGEFDESHEGSEIVIATEMGETYEVISPDEVIMDHWPRNLIWDNRDNSGWVVKIADVFPGNEGNEIVYGSRYNNKIMISYATSAEDPTH